MQISFQAGDEMIGKYAIKRITHKEGWAVILISGLTYTLTWENAGHIGNTSYDGTFSYFEPGQYIIMKQKSVAPDR